MLNYIVHYTTLLNVKHFYLIVLWNETLNITNNAWLLLEKWL